MNMVKKFQTMKKIKKKQILSPSNHLDLSIPLLSVEFHQNGPDSTWIPQFSGLACLNVT